MTEIALLLVSTVLVNNFVLAKFLGLCPFMGVSKKLDSAYGMALATGFVLTLSAASSLSSSHRVIYWVHSSTTHRWPLTEPARTSRFSNHTSRMLCI